MPIERPNLPAAAVLVIAGLAASGWIAAYATVSSSAPLLAASLATLSGSMIGLGYLDDQRQHGEVAA